MCHDTNFGCGQHGHHEFAGRGTHGNECCCTHGYGRRRFFSHKEVIAKLEEYLNDLRSEIKGVEERIAEMKKEVKSQPT